MLLVTGASGFLGRRVVQALQQAGHSPVRCLLHRSPGDGALPDGVEYAHGSVQDPASLAAAMDGIDAVVHLVGIIRERRPSTTFAAVNHGGTRNVAEAAKAAGVRHVVYVSALGARDDARFPYARSKWLGEQEIIGSGVPYTILRPSILFGEGDEFFNTLAALVKMLPLVPVAGSGANRFQPIAADDVARCVATAVLREAYYGRVIEVGGPRQYTYRELLRTVATVLGVRRLRVHVPIVCMRTMAAVMECVLPRPPVTREQLRYLDLDSVADEDAVEREFAFAPQPLEEGLGYIRSLRLRHAMAMLMGVMPRQVRDH